jgi:hypothetical protein
MQNLRHEKCQTDSPTLDGESAGRQTSQTPAPRGHEPDCLSGYAGDNSSERGEVTIHAETESVYNLARNAASTLAATMTLRHMATRSGVMLALKHSPKSRHIMSVAD